MLFFIVLLCLTPDKFTCKIDLVDPVSEKSRERQTWDICIANVTCKNWQRNLLSTCKPQLCRKNATVNFGTLANVPPPPPHIFSTIFSLLAYIERCKRWSLKDGLEPSLLTKERMLPLNGLTKCNLPMQSAIPLSGNVSKFIVLPCQPLMILLVKGRITIYAAFKGLNNIF